MKFLVDTHVLLWALADEQQLTVRAKNAVADPANVAFVSMASLWEISIKESLGKIELPAAFYGSLKTAGFEVLPILLDHVELSAKLPFYHRDPFDRMLVAQAIHEQLTLITCDGDIKKYSANILWD